MIKTPIIPTLRWFAIGLFVLFAASSSTAEPGSPAIEVKRVVYLTANLDSLTKVFIDRGFRVERGAFDPTGVSSNVIRLPSGQTIELQTTYTTDTNDWRLQALRAYRTHIAGLVFHVDSILRLRSLKERQVVEVDVAHHEVRRSALMGPKPLDVVFTHNPLDRSTAEEQPNGIRRIQWVLLTVSDSTEAMMRNVFDAFAIHRSHAGCCDYWIIGPPENRTGLRFELPSTTFRGTGDWLSIEEGGLVFD